MYKTPREDRFLIPSFSSTLLDQIYRSIDDGETKLSKETKFYIETTTSSNRKDNKLRTEKVLVSEMEDNRKLQNDHDQDVLFFSSTSISSSDSSSGGFSSSDTESLYGTRSRASCFAPPRPKPVRTSASFRLEKQGTTRFCRKEEDIAITRDDTCLIKSKSRALKIYNNLKKVKQPISPGGKLTSFLNSLFATGNAKKKSKGTCEDVNAERKTKSGQASSSSTCSSASSFSRSCLSKTMSSDRDRLCSGVKRTVRFYPVEEEKKSRVVEEAAREFLREYRHTQKKNDFVLKDLPLRTNVNVNYKDDDEEDDDDAASYASSDLFELDHLAVLGNGRYCDDLPVYETTHVNTNRAIAKGLLV